MKYEIITKPAFSVIGKEGSTNDGEDFIQKLYQAANQGFNEVKELIKLDDNGKVSGSYGLMSDFPRSLKPWEEDFSKGLYLAGYELKSEIKSIPNGWSVWHVPSQEYFLVKLEKGDEYKQVFNDFINYYIPLELRKLSGAVFDYYSLKDNQQCLLFPVKPFHFKRVATKQAQMARCGLVCSYCFFTSCPGCEKEACKCTYGYWCPDHICPTVKCSKDKGLKGCYECEQLESCNFGFFSTGNKSAKACSMFVKQYGKDKLVQTIEKMNELDLNWNKLLEQTKDANAAFILLKEYQEK